MNIQFKKGVLELCVLALIDGRDRYGYEIIETISQHMDVAEGTIYPLLKRLQLDGHCETYLQESQGGPPRKYYRLTHSGRSHAGNLAAEWKHFVASVGDIIQSGGSLG